MSNIDGKTRSYHDRLLALETSRRELGEDIKELMTEAKSAGFSKDEIAGIKLAVRRSFESEDKKAARISAEEFAAALGDFADLPLGSAAIRAVA